MPGPQLTPVSSDLQLPDRADVVVIGGGIVGTSTALELAERGLSVLLCEKGVIGGEQSSRNWGWVRLSMRDPREIPLMIEALRLWEGLDVRTGRKTGYRRAGILFTADSEKTYAEHARWAEHLTPYQVESKMVSGADLDALLPGHRMDLKGALYTPRDGRAEPQWAAPAVAEAAREAGAVVMTGCAVRSLDVAAGRVTGVVTEKGRVGCDAVVLAGGAWSRLFAGNSGVQLPQLKVLNTVMRTSPVEGGPEASVWAGGFALRKRADGGYTVASGTENTVDFVPDSFRLARAFLPALFHEWSSLKFRLSGRWSEEARQPRHWRPEDITPFETCRILDPTPSERVLRQCWGEAQQAFPILQGAERLQSWSGMIDVTPDAVPVISGVEDLPGLHIATGFSGHGFGIGPAAGRLMADLVTGSAPVVDPQAFRLSRFSDGSRVYLDKGF
ncbi:NAD(P)/FAD-dependent oxidoreductase [Antarcticimicrobium sediminis]|uniref:FAD-binding oxidoreductase n=1 Tax=Antarcticimicrobium sediminis TaxID=2546227 RepID=A0A4R5EXM0_9RHOB|nr:FAD-binding oxidoreductase [Antarcticimicrobium sediminis]TDE39570.1 FAD-binding oxidoreductase [Antarcticimicrobium sediminis]